MTVPARLRPATWWTVVASSSKESPEAASTASIVWARRGGSSNKAFQEGTSSGLRGLDVPEVQTALDLSF